MRGNLPCSVGSVNGRRSIPAHAGEPRCHRSPPPTGRVYPRPCGGTGAAGVVGHAESGLSPPMRGNLTHIGQVPMPRRSIPAHAGEPPVGWRVLSHRRVYPRPCGGTCWRMIALTNTCGLSPPMRGNHRGSADRHANGGSIPAHAGEPPLRQA